MKIAPALLIISFILCVIVFIPGIGIKLSNVYRWINFRLFLFQPSELAKIAVVVNLAVILHKKKDKIENFFTGVAYPLLIVILFFLLVVLQPDFTTAIFIILVSVFMLFIAGTPARHLAILGGIGVPIIAILTSIAGYRLKRIWAFISSDSDSLGAGFQILESLKAFDRGGFLGVGIGKGYKTLPEPFTDFIFSVYGEEAGFLGCALVILLFAIFTYRGIRIASRCQDSFLSLLAYGLTAMISLQAIVNFMSSLGLIPTTGITLPFLSYGRSSLIISCAVAGILLNISKKTQVEAE